LKGFWAKSVGFTNFFTIWIFLLMFFKKIFMKVKKINQILGEVPLRDLLSSNECRASLNP